MKKIEEARMIEKNKRETREKQKNMIKGMIGEMKGGMEKVKEIDQDNNSFIHELSIVHQST